MRIKRGGGDSLSVGGGRREKKDDQAGRVKVKK